MDSLVGQDPKDILVLHGPTKRLVNHYHWHEPEIGIVASYTPTDRDLEDHFNIFRGVDQIESFAQSTTGSCIVFLECKKLGITPYELPNRFFPRFISIGEVIFHNYLEKGDILVNIGHIKFYKFRQMVCDGRIYKAPKGLDLDLYFSNFNEDKLLNYNLQEDFTLITELKDITARSIKKELLNKYEEQ